MKRWNGWGDEQVDFPVPPSGQAWLARQIGEGAPQPEATLDRLLRSVPDSPLPSHPLVNTQADERLFHARGQSLPDWIAKRYGAIDAFPAGVAYPRSEEDLQSLFHYAKTSSIRLIPYGGGTSVVGHINPAVDAPPSLTVDLSRMDRLLDLDEQNLLATFEAGVQGPTLEAALQARGYTLGHFPQSFEFSSLGGWIATRSAGQQALHYGRIENTFAGGRLISPTDTLVMRPYPASAAGPDLREFVLGSEGRLGFISQATVRISRLPEREKFYAIVFHDWQEAVEAARKIVQARLPLSMLRLSDALETEANLAIAGHESLINQGHRALAALGYQRSRKCLLIFGATGRTSAVGDAQRHTVRIARQHGGLYLGPYLGQQWRKGRFRAPYLRNTLWNAGYAVDTLETVISWSEVFTTGEAILKALREGLAPENEQVLAFGHLSHVYRTGASFYVTYLFRLQPSAEQTLAYWRRLKTAASQAIVQHGATISHQHGVGTDHAPYLAQEKGQQGINLLRAIAEVCDPDHLLMSGTFDSSGEQQILKMPKGDNKRRE